VYTYGVRSAMAYRDTFIDRGDMFCRYGTLSARLALPFLALSLGKQRVNHVVGCNCGCNFERRRQDSTRWEQFFTGGRVELRHRPFQRNLAREIAPIFPLSMLVNCVPWKTSDKYNGRTSEGANHPKWNRC
jgi:hypothetical protein